MAINLIKGQRQPISAPKFTIGLGWDANDSGKNAFDLDASVFILGENKKLLSKNHFVYFGNLASPNRAVEHTGDNLTGEGDGDDEQIKVDLSKIDVATTEICIVVNIYQAQSRKQCFGQVKNSFVRIFETDTEREILKFELREDFSKEDVVEFGRIYKRRGEWKFEATGGGVTEEWSNYKKKFR
jgi:tellurium resistance protein TerD